MRSEEHTSELQSRQYLVCRLLLEKIAEDYYDADEHTLLEHWNPKHSSIAGKFGTSDCHRIPLEVGRRGPNIVDLNHLFRERHAASGGFRVGTKPRHAPPMLSEYGRCIVQAGTIELFFLA